MLPFEDRYSRQRRLEEVGPEGQQRLERAEVFVAEHAGVALELDYLARAGVQRAALRAGARELGFPWQHHFRFAAPLAVARGAWCALCRLRTVLEGKPTSER
jgi:hypothetical protein